MFSPIQWSDLSIISFNIRYQNNYDGADGWLLRRKGAIEMLKSYCPDILCMQEVLHSQLLDLLKALPNYQSIGKSRNGNEDDEYGPIFYDATKFEIVESGMFWLSLTPDIPSKYPGAALNRICTWARLKGKGLEFYVFNVHLDHISSEARINGVKVLLERVKVIATDDYPIFLCGDYNCEQCDSEEIQIVLNAGYEDSYIHGPEQHFTWHDFGKITFDPIPRKIDYIFVETHLRPNVTFAVIIRDKIPNGRYPSDHFPVMTKLKLPLSK